MHLVNVSFPACLAPFTEEILNGKLIFLGSVTCAFTLISLLTVKKTHCSSGEVV